MIIASISQVQVVDGSKEKLFLAFYGPVVSFTNIGVALLPRRPSGMTQAQCTRPTLYAM